MRNKARGQLKPLCKNCRNKYELNEAMAIADANKTNIVACPHCGAKVGTSHG